VPGRVSLPGPLVVGPFQLVLPLTHETPPALESSLSSSSPPRRCAPLNPPLLPRPPPQSRGRASSPAPFVRASARRPPLRPPVLHYPGRVSDPGAAPAGLRPAPCRFPRGTRGAGTPRRWTATGHSGIGANPIPSANPLHGDWCVLSTQSPSRFSPRRDA